MSELKYYWKKKEGRVIIKLTVAFSIVTGFLIILLSSFLPYLLSIGFLTGIVFAYFLFDIVFEWLLKDLKQVNKDG